MQSKFENGTARYAKNSPCSQAVLSKLSVDLTGGKSQLPGDLPGFYQVECDKLHPFRLKTPYDFSPWTEEKFGELLLSVQEFGVLTPLILRPSQEYGYEILAGEHRWKACCTLDIPKVPAQILTDCNDHKARAIFTLTNLLSRELTLADKIQAWSQYYILTREKAMETIANLEEMGVFREKEDISRRQILRYHKINLLPPPLRNLVFTEQISIHSGEQLSTLSTNAQEILAPFGEKIQNPSTIKDILALYQGEIQGYDFDHQGLLYIFSEKPRSPLFSTAMQKAKGFLKQRLKKEEYLESDVLLAQAFSMYDEFFQDQALYRTAMAEYKKTHPDINA